MSEPPTAADTPAASGHRKFRNAMGLFATGVAVIAAADGDDEVVAMTANAVSSVSLEPMLVLFCPSRRSRLAQHMRSHDGGFTINFLRHDQQALATFFAGSWKEPVPPPFRFVPAACAPRLEGCLASIHCDREQLIEAGDHWIAIGRVRDVHIGIPPHKPLLFLGGRYRHLAVADSTPAPDLVDVHEEPAHIFYDHD